jgi:hypothetical protein
MNAIRFLSLVGVGSLSLTASLSAPSQSVTASSSVIPHVRVFGGRSADQALRGKFDATLADVASHLSMVRAGSELSDLHAMNPAIRVRQLPGSSQPLVLIDAVTRGDSQALRDSLEALGLVNSSAYMNDVSGWLPVSSLAAASALGQLHSIRAAMPRKRTGAVTSQGDFAQGTEQLRTADPGLTGAGVTVGVLSDSFNCYAVYAQPNSGVPASGNNGYAFNGFTADYATDVSTGALPSGINVLEEAFGGQEPGQEPCGGFAPTFLPDSDEGRAMLQMAHDVAPGASLAFHTAGSGEADFANGIVALASAGAKVEADDIGYPDEPFFQDGLIAQAVDQVQSQGVAYFSAAGNDAKNSYETTAPSYSAPVTSGPETGESLLQFTAAGQPAASSLSVNLPELFPGEFIYIVLQWDQPYVTGTPTDANSPGASSQLDLCITGASGGNEVLGATTSSSNTCSGLNALGSDPNQILLVGVPANAAGHSPATTINITVGLGAGSVSPGRIKLAVDDDGAGAVINPVYATNSPTSQGHPGAAGAIAVGAAFYFDTPLCGTSPAQPETFSSLGGDPILFDTSGNRLATPVIRQKPEVVGPDGGNNTFLGAMLSDYGITGSNNLLSTNIQQCQNNPSYPNFLGTSAATPHVAGLAALMLQANSSLTPTQILTALETSASPMGSSTPNYTDGYGFVQAGAALALLPPGAPTITGPSSQVVVGNPATLTWSSLNTTGCTASGDWSGALAASGSQTVTPSAAGTATYTLTCSNAQGSASSSVMLDVVTMLPATQTPAHSGGGAFDGWTVGSLMTLWLIRQRRQRLANRA